MRNISFFFSFLISLCVFISCSGESSVTLPNEKANSAVRTGSEIWGLYEIMLDLESGEASVIPMRTADFSTNIVKFLDAPPINVKLANLTTALDGQFVNIGIDIGIEHPFPTLAKFTGFDVIGVFLGAASFKVPFDQTLIIPGLSDTRLMNADGFTRWFNAVEFSDAGQINPLFGYIPTVLGPKGFKPTGTLNPYKYYADLITKEQSAFNYLKTHHYLRGQFKPGTTLWRKFELRRPLASAVYFQYAVVAHWAPNKNHPNPPYTINDWPMEANADESLAIEIIDKSDLFYDAPGEFGGKIDIDLSIWDWTATESNPEYQIYIYSSAWKDPYVVTGVPVETGNGYMKWHAEGAPQELKSKDPVALWIAVAYPSKDYTNKFGVPNTAPAPLATYFAHEVEVTSSDPAIKVVAPNGGEEWQVASTQEIVWTSQGVSGYVNIYYSKDGFKNDIHQIAWNTPNDGTHNWEKIPNDPSTTVKVKIESMNNPTIFDISDANFKIVAQDCSDGDYFESEGNNSSTDADVLPMDYRYSKGLIKATGRNCPEEDVDWYKINLTQGTFSILLTAPGMTSGQILNAQLYNSSMAEQGLASMSYGTAAMRVRVPKGATAGYYYLKVWGSGGVIDYVLWPLRNPDETETSTFYEKEPNATPEFANIIPIDYNPDSDPAKFTGQLTADDNDWFKFELISPGYLIVHIADYDLNPSSIFYVTLYDSASKKIEEIEMNNMTGSSFITSKGILPMGNYYLWIRSNTSVHRYVFEPLVLGGED